MRISNYENAKIYAVVDNKQTIVYIGTTNQTLLGAWQNMKTRLLRDPPCLHDPFIFYLYWSKRQRHKIILLENYPCKLFYQLQMRANEYVRIHNPIVNQLKEHHNNFKRITGIRKTEVQCPCCVNNIQFHKDLRKSLGPKGIRIIIIFDPFGPTPLNFQGG